MAKLRIKARAIDMLGRQQIAGIPSAIHELFKNAHDAYADNVLVDYFRSDALFVLRDDGVGMTEDEFLQRWLTVGTDSKMEAGTLPSIQPEHVEPRPVLGEKGIGRLAIATIGRLVLVLTQSRRRTPGSGVTASLVHWGFFQIAGLEVDRVDVPLITLKDGEKPDATLIELLKEAVLENVRTLDGAAPPQTLSSIREDVEKFDLDFEALYDEIGGPRLDRIVEHGTQFFILPADRIIENDIDDNADYVASSLTKSLLGFSNTMVPGATPPPILASFKNHRLDGVKEELIGDRSFFTPEEFDRADHHFSGEFDSFGQFRGKVAVYGNAPTDYQVSWPNPSGTPTACGPFTLNFAYVQGAARESRLDPEEYALIMEKLNRIGGLYLYRDGVRILPYGNSDYDFLDIERRRSKGAAYYFFSFRRMFGAIETTRANNSGLVEKAGREGFQQNAAYRQFKQMLENFLVQLAADFFRDGGIYADAYSQIKLELDRNEEIRRKRDKQAKAKRTSFARELEKFFEQMSSDTPALDAARLAEETGQRLRVAARIPDSDRAAAQILKLEENVRQSMAELQERFRIRKPQGFGLTKPLLRDWAVYRKQCETLESEVFAPLVMQIDRIFSEVVAEFNVQLDHRRRVDEAIRDVGTRATKELGLAARKTSDEARKMLDGTVSRTNQTIGSLNALLQEVKSEFASTVTSEMTDAEMSALGKKLQDRITMALETEISTLSNIRARLATVLASDLSETITPEQLTEAMEEQIESLRDEVELYLELAQLGMAVGVVQHDFGDAIRTIRSNIRALQPWANVNKDLATLHTSLKTSFEHLDGYLTLFTPLNRRLYRTKISILGENIAHFVDGIFADRLKDSDIHLIATDEFRKHEIEGYPSTFFPVFVNLVENARYWVEESGVKPAKIVLDAAGDDFLVSDTGRGVSDRDRDAIFDYGFTRKKAGGQGLGLFISRQVLRRAGWELRLDPNVEARGATFRISPPPEELRDVVQDNESTGQTT